MVGASGEVPRGYLKIGDDVAVLPSGPGKLVMKVDMLVERTDVPPKMTYRQAARKAVAMCVSDFAAKGVKPDSFMVSMGVKRGVKEGEVRQLAQGIRDAEAEWGVHLVGGDTNEADQLVIDCAMVGFSKSVVTRSGAAPGDLLVVTGLFGLPPSGLRILMFGASAESDFASRAKESVLSPTPNLKVGLALAPLLSSGMDSSDGLARSIHTLAKESGVGFGVTVLPYADGVKTFARRNGLNADSLVLEGGEEYIIVGTLKRSKLNAAMRAVRRAGGQLLVIGEASGRKGRVELARRETSRPIRDVGWTHLG